MSNNDTKGVRSLKHHTEYYLGDGNLHLLAEDTHFRVHSYFFTRESAVFRHTLENPASPGKESRGTSDSNALVLDQVTPEDFSKFLWVFYDSGYSRCTTVDHWTVILDLAHRWGFNAIRELAFHSLEQLEISLVGRIALYQQYDAPDNILHPHYSNLCSRPEILTLKETEILGGQTSVMIFAIREKLLSIQPGARTLDKIEKDMFHKGVNSYFNVKKRVQPTDDEKKKRDDEKKVDPAANKKKHS